MYHKHSKRYSTVRTYFGSSRRHQTQTVIMLSFTFLTILLSLWISILMQVS